MSHLFNFISLQNYKSENFSLIVTQIYHMILKDMEYGSCGSIWCFLVMFGHHSEMQILPNILFFCGAEAKRSYRFEMSCGWVSNERIWVNYLFNLTINIVGKQDLFVKVILRLNK